MDFYAHAFSKCHGFDNSDIDKLEEILKSGYLLSRRKLGLCKETSVYNGMDYISLCDLSLQHQAYSAYFMYIKNGLSLLFDKNIAVIKPIIVERNYGSLIIYAKKMHELGMSRKRYSDLFDEVQVKDKLSLDYLRGVALSLERIYEFHYQDYIKEYLQEIKEKLMEYGYDVPIYNIDCEKKVNIKKL